MREVDPLELDNPPERDELYGFRWGPAVVERTDEYRGGGKAKRTGTRRMTKVLTVRPDQGDPIELHISSTGASIRVYRVNNEGARNELRERPKRPWHE